MSLKESCFADCWKVSSAVTLFKNVGKRSTATNHHLVSLVFVVNKVLEKLVNNRIVDCLRKCHLFSDFQYGFRSSTSIADLPTVKSNRIVSAFNRSGLLEVQHLIYPRVLMGFAMLIFLTNLSRMKFQVRYLTLFLLCLLKGNFGCLWIRSLHKNIQLMLEFLNAPFLLQHFSYYT